MSDGQPTHAHRKPGSFGVPRRAALAGVVGLVLVVGGCVAVRAMTSPSTPTAAPSTRPRPSGTTTPPPPLANTSVSPNGSASCVDTVLAKMSLTQQVGQVLMIGTPLANPTTIVGTVRKYQLGGVFLAGRSTASAATMRRDIGIIQAAAPTGVPLQIALDQEGGVVQTLSGADFPSFPSAVAQGQESTSTLKAQATAWATRLHDIGVTIDLAPVSDVVPAGTASGNPPIGALDRQYGSTPAQAAHGVTTVVAAVQGAGVQTTLKHFPGLGRVRYNTDNSTRAVDSQTTATDPSLQPFIDGIKAGTAAVMISSASYPKLDPNEIGPFSEPIVTGLLKDKLGFTGVIISDDFGSATAVKAVPIGQRAVRFLQAGGDLVLTNVLTNAGPMQTALLAEAQSSTTFHTRLTDAARHVLASKARAGLLPC